MARVVEINNPDQLEPYRLVWTALLAETPGGSFFQTLDWLKLFWKHFGGEHRLRVLIVEAAGRPIGIVPLCVRVQRRQIGRVRVLTYPLDGWGTRYSPIGRAPAATLTMAMRHLASTPRDWDVIDLPWVDADGHDRGRTARAMEGAGLPCIQTPETNSSLITLDRSWDDYVASRSPKTRSDIRRKLRRIDQLEGVEYVRYRPSSAACGGGDPAWDLYEQCEAVARNSWQAELTDGNTITHDRCRPFLREAHEAAARLGMLDLNLLRINGEPVAFNYNYHSGGEVFGLRMGFLAGCEVPGVGVALVLLTLRDSFERGDRRFEMGEGGQSYKNRLGTDEQTSWRLTHTPTGSWRSQAFRLGRMVRSLRPSKVSTGKSPTAGKAGVG